MRYTKPQIVATLAATNVIQRVEDSGPKPPAGYFDRTFNECTSSGYDADE